MQRSAPFVFTMSLLIVGCADNEGRIVARLPEPIFSTRPWSPHAVPPPSPEPPPPLPQPEAPGGWPADIRPRGGIDRDRWRVIVVHHSEKANATPEGMNRYHIQRGWEHGLGYHFVIGNGVGYPDGRIFVGPRWRQQITGAHCRADSGVYFGVRRPDNFFNEHGIGICLIGNFDQSRPSPRQIAALEQLISYLCEQANIPPAQIHGHGEVTHRTACPGRFLRQELAGVRRAVAQALAVRGGTGLRPGL